MDNTLDEATKSMAQSILRFAALKRFSAAFAIIGRVIGIAGEVGEEACV